MAYLRDDIERVRDATDLVELVGEVTKVKRSGRSIMAVCPFHQEKTPSMSVDAARGLYHCFGCGESGDLFTFVQRTQGLEFSDAVELLARRTGITLHRDPDAAKRRDRRQILVDAVAAAVAFYHDRLRTESDAANARSYLRGRGYDGEVVDRYMLGYSPAAGDPLIRHLGSKGTPEPVMISAGLAGRGRTGRLFDRFRGRIMFPIFDLRGDPIGFGARLLDGDGPKYLNSPETPIYRKSTLLYGLNWAKGEIVRQGTALVVEGYTDVIGLGQAGFGTAVATCGTALGAEHLEVLRRFSERLVLMFDADEAGAMASLRGFEHSVPGDLDLRVAALPVGRDPADLAAAADIETLRKAIDDSVPLLQFRIERELSGFDGTEPEARGRAVRAAAALVALHPDQVTRHEYAVFIARRTGVDLDVVLPAVERAVARVAGRPAAPAEARSGRDKAERDLLGLLLANDPGVCELDLDASVFAHSLHAMAYEIIAPALADISPGVAPDLGTLLGSAEGEAASLLRTLAFEGPAPPEAQEALRRVQAATLDEEIEAIKREISSAERHADADRASELLGNLIALEHRRRKIWGPE